MFLFVFLLCCVLQSILHYYCAFGKRESLQRFVVEEGAKPAIFGSYSYDPVRQVFVPPPPDPNDVNDTSKHHSQKPDTLTGTQTQTTTVTQTHTITNAQSLQLTSTPSESSPSQSVQDKFISTVGDSGTDSPDAIYNFLRKQVPPLDNKSWWQQPNTTLKNVTNNFI